MTLAAAAFFAPRLDRVGQRLGLPETLLGLLTALAADAPEVSSAIAALVRGAHDVGVGVVLGSNVFNLAAMVGLSALLVGGVRIRRDELAVEGAVGVGATLVVGLLILKVFGAWVALTLLALIVVPYLVRLFREAHRPDRVDAHHERILVPALTLLPALVVIVAGATGMVDAALKLSDRWDVPDVIVGIVVLAILTSLPNAFTAVRLAFQGRGSALVSETLNSNTVNLVFGVSIPALFIAVGSTSGLTWFDLAWLLLMTVLVLAALARPRGVERSEGVAILLLYAVFVVVQIVAEST